MIVSNVQERRLADIGKVGMGADILVRSDCTLSVEIFGATNSNIDTDAVGLYFDAGYVASGATEANINCAEYLTVGKNLELVRLAY